MRLSSSNAKIAALTVALLAFMLSPLQAATLAEYDAVLGKVAAECKKALAAEEYVPGSSQAALDRLMADLPSDMIVRSGDHEIKADLSWIKSELKSARETSGGERAEEIQRLISRIETHRTAAAGASESRSDSALQARAALDEVLSRKEFKPSWQTIMTQRIRDAIHDLLARIRISPGAADVVSWVILAVGITIFLAALVLTILHLMRGYRFHGRTSGTSKTGRRAVTKPVRRTVESLLESAEQEAANGRYREAYRNLYLAGLLLLDRAGLVTYTDSSTNWEYLRALSRQSATESADILHSMTLSFDNLIYGRAEVTADDYHIAKRQYGQLEEAV